LVFLTEAPSILGWICVRQSDVFGRALALALGE
jgi:hypothetical protein